MGELAMILRRLTANLKAQNWTAIAIEFLIVVIGVFVGTWVANWNQERMERRESRHLLLQLQPELGRILDFTQNVRAYYATTRRFAETAFAGWAREPNVTDHDFVIAAYQASQIHGLNNSTNWTIVFGGDQLHNIDDTRLREPLGRLMSFNIENLNSNYAMTAYRDDVRKIIPDDLQQRIRAACGDRLRGETADFMLPESCNVMLDPHEVAATAAELRRHPELVGELRQHLGTVSSYLNQVTQYEVVTRQLQSGIAASTD
jgi:hypothetical protein